MRCGRIPVAPGDGHFAYPEFSDVAPVPPKAGASGRAERGLARGRSAKCEHRALARAERFCGTSCLPDVARPFAQCGEDQARHFERRG